MRLACETEIAERGRRAKPSACGKPAQTYLVSGGLAAVKVALCADHLEITVSRGYAVVPMETQAVECSSALPAKVEGDA